MRTARRLLQGAIFATVVAGFVVPGLGASAAPVKPSIASLQQQIKDQSTALEQVVEQYNQVTIDLQTNQKAAAKVATQLATTKTSLDSAKGGLASMAAAAYMNGSGGAVNGFTVLIASDSTTQLLDQLSTMNQIATERKQKISGVVTLQNTYLAQKQTLDDLIAAQNAKRKDLAAQKVTITTKLNALYKMRTAAFGSATEKPPASTGGSHSGGSSGSSSGGGSSSHPTPPSVPGRGGRVVSFAYAQIGKPYAWARSGPGSYDCSGLVLAAYRSVGVSLPHNARAQYGVVHHISRSQLSPGDLVFYESLGHVAIYIGNGKVIHAPTFGERVKISSITMMSPYGYGRV